MPHIGQPNMDSNDKGRKERKRKRERVSYHHDEIKNTWFLYINDSFANNVDKKANYF